MTNLKICQTEASTHKRTHKKKKPSCIRAHVQNQRHPNFYLDLFMFSSSGSCTERSTRHKHQHALLMKTVTQLIAYRPKRNRSNTTRCAKWCRFGTASIMINNRRAAKSSDCLQTRQNTCHWQTAARLTVEAPLGAKKQTSALLSFQLHPPSTVQTCYDKPTLPNPSLCCLTPLTMPGLTEVSACELGQDAEGAGLGGAGAGLPVLSVLDQPLLATVIGDKAGKVLHPEAVPAHTSREQHMAGAG